MFIPHIMNMLFKFLISFTYGFTSYENIYFIYWNVIYVHILLLHMGRFAIAFLFCILAIFFWWTVKLLLLFQKVDWYNFVFSKCERPCVKRHVVLEMKKMPLKELCSNTDVLHNDCVNIDSRCFSMWGKTSNNASLVLLAWSQFLISISTALHETLHWATDLAHKLPL